MNKLIAMLTIFSFVAVCGFCGFVVDTTNSSDVAGDVHAVAYVDSHVTHVADAGFISAIANAIQKVQAVVGKVQEVAGKVGNVVNSVQQLVGGREGEQPAENQLMFQLD